MEKELIRDLLKDFINKSEIIKHFMKNVKLIDVYGNYFTFIVLKTFFLTWISINEINEEILDEVLNVHYEKENRKDIIKRIKAYKILYVNYKNDDNVEIFIKDKKYILREKYEDYDVYLNYKNWRDVFDCYAAVPKVKDLFLNIEFILSLRELSKKFLNSKTKIIVQQEVTIYKMKQSQKISNLYYLSLMLKCFILQVYKWDKIYEELLFYYDKKNLEEKLDFFMKFGFLKDEQIIKIIKNIDI